MTSNLRAFDLNLLTVFDAIYRARNMTKAAERLHMSQPAASLALNRLRHHLGDPLFARRGGFMEPTVRAQQLAGPIRRILDTAVNAVLRQPGFDYVSSKREFNFALGEYGNCLVVPRIAEQFEQLGVGATFCVSGLAGEPAEEAMREGTLDIFLRPIRSWAEISSRNSPRPTLCRCLPDAIIPRSGKIYHSRNIVLSVT